LKFSRYNRNVKVCRPYMERQNSHVTTSTSSSATKTLRTRLISNMA